MTIVRDDAVRSGVASRGAAWCLAAGGALFFIGGAMHPHEDPPNVTVKQHLQVMFGDRIWYPAHTVLMVAVALMALSIALLIRGGAFNATKQARVIAKVAAVASALATVSALVHLLMKTEATALALGHATPIIDANNVTESLITPAFGLSIAALAFIGATTRTLRPRPLAVFAVIGGVAYALAGGTFLLTDALDPLFPLAGAIGVWAVAVGISLVWRSRAAEDAAPMAASSGRPVGTRDAVV